MASVKKCAAQEFWIPVDGIDREIIIHDVPHYQAPDALAGQPRNFIEVDEKPTLIFSQQPTILSRARHQPLRPPLVRRNAMAWPVSGTDVNNTLSHEGLRALLSDHPMSDFENSAPNEIRRARSDSGETYRTSLSTSVNLRTRLSSVCCEGPHSGHTHTVDAFLDTGATDNVISQKLYTILEAMEAVEMKDDGDIFHIGSPIGEVIEVTGSTKVNIRWFDHEGENVRKRIEFKVIPGLYPDMIFKPTTFQELGMLLAADTWPRDDPRESFLMFNTPWLSSKQKQQNKKQHEIKKAANAARAAQERKDREDERAVIRVAQKLRDLKYERAAICATEKIRDIEDEHAVIRAAQSSEVTPWAYQNFKDVSNFGAAPVRPELLPSNISRPV